MKTSRRDFLINGSKGLVAVALGNSLTACASSAPAIQRSFPEFHASGYGFRDRTEAEEPYILERAVIFEKEFYIQEVSGREGELPFIFLPFNETRRRIDADTGRLRLESDKNYIPRKVRIGSNNRLASEVDLMMYRSPEGIKGVRADILSLEELRRRVGVSKNNYGFSGVTTELDAEYKIRTMSILGVEYFFPHVKTNETGEQDLDFHLIPVKGSEIIIQNSDGMITLRNPGNIYRPILILGNESEEETSPSQVETIRKE